MNDYIDRPDKTAPTSTSEARLATCNAGAIHTIRTHCRAFCTISHDAMHAAPCGLGITTMIAGLFGMLCLTAGALWGLKTGPLKNWSEADDPLDPRPPAE